MPASAHKKRRRRFLRILGVHHKLYNPDRNVRAIRQTLQDCNIWPAIVEVVIRGCKANYVINRLNGYGCKDTK